MAPNATETTTKDTARTETTRTGKCPFEPKAGYATLQGRSEWLQDRGYSSKEADKISKSLEATLDTTKPLYYWQLYSLLGQDRIYKIVKTFYEYVFDDTDHRWFRDVFVRIAPLDHHVLTQALYWIDVMGGGKHYHGGSYRIDFHHTYNARDVMNARGATRWMHHMRRALLAQDFSDDPRILPCIMDFLKVKMKRYAEEHGWEFDESDFDIKKQLNKEGEEDAPTTTETPDTASVASSETLPEEEKCEIENLSLY